jgi:predicted DNA-binding transcriptional regulator AlpA
MQQEALPTPGELASVPELAEELGMGESTAWLLVKRYDLPRFRLPGHGKTTFVRRSDFEEARQTPILIGGGSKKAVV